MLQVPAPERHGDIRHAEGVWNGDDVKPTYPPQISDISEVTA